MSTEIERIKEIIKVKGMNKSQFMKDLGYSHVAFLKWEKGAKIGEKTLKLIEMQYNINPNWLRTGTGSMFLEDSDKKMDSDIVNIAPAYDLPERFLQLAGKLKNSDIAKVEGYMQAIIDEYKNKDMQKLSS